MGNEWSKIYVQIFASGFIFEMMYIKKKIQVKSRNRLVGWYQLAPPP